MRQDLRRQKLLTQQLTEVRPFVPGMIACAGGIDASYSIVTFQGEPSFANNSAGSNGGGYDVIPSRILRCEVVLVRCTSRFATYRVPRPRPQRTSDALVISRLKGFRRIGNTSGGMIGARSLEATYSPNSSPEFRPFVPA